MVKILFPSIAVILVALYLITRKRKIEFEFEIEPRDEDKSGEPESVVDTSQLMAE
jgi:hypothetical protein